MLFKILISFVLVNGWLNAALADGRRIDQLSVWDEAYYELKENQLVVMNDDEGYVLFALCPRTVETQRVSACETLYYGSYRQLCEERKKDISVFSGLTFVGKSVAGLFVPISIPLVLSLSMNAGSLGKEVFDQSEIWTYSCLEENSEEDGDMVVNKLRAYSGMTANAPIQMGGSHDDVNFYLLLKSVFPIKKDYQSRLFILEDGRYHLDLYSAERLVYEDKSANKPSQEGFVDSHQSRRDP